MFKTIQRISLLGLVLMLGACAGPSHKPYDPAVRTKIRSIGLLTPAISDKVAVRMVVHPGQSFGVVGMLLAQGDMDGKSGDFTRAATGKGFYCSRKFRDELNISLSDAGYDVHPIKVERTRGVLEFMHTYPKSDGSVDAYLDMYTDLVGYIAAGGGTPYRPTVYLNVRLVRATDHKVLYQDRIAYNAFGDGDGAITLTPSKGYEFSEFDHLVANPSKALEGLQVAMRATGDELARQLR